MIYNEFKGMKLSRLGFGCMRFIMDKESGKVDQDKVNAMFDLAIKGGVMAEEHISGQIGEVLLGQKPGRTSEKEITVFDATGLALLDLAVAKQVVEGYKDGTKINL